MWFSLCGPLVNFDCTSQSLRLGSFTTLSFLCGQSIIWWYFIYLFIISHEYRVRFQKNFYDFMRFWPIRQVVNLSPIYYIEFIIRVCPYCSLSIFIFFPNPFRRWFYIYIYICFFFFCIKAELKIMIMTITWTKNLHRISKTFWGDLIHMSTLWVWTSSKLEINGNLGN